ncbi:hypothetical protein VFPFJ_03179 [Purpureocillium lilacinum]|uniref:Uncharacterized protein n=1 Tax=Purpureocillium lilacinum TaxID=33203 RepID=A0A179HPP0_PURLI|nr:hypothetical protein VFPFJ_03179 [Purpureocillium lilacinum]OAQ91439.1 hypothetical protein VFPFJ_03179 [Purpureocillium lilacinum]
MQEGLEVTNYFTGWVALCRPPPSFWPLSHPVCRQSSIQCSAWNLPVIPSIPPLAANLGTIGARAGLQHTCLGSWHGCPPVSRVSSTASAPDRRYPG